jgi:hypothetical protein
MNAALDHNLALDLATTNVTDHDELVVFLATHVLNPTRSIFHMPTAEPGEEVDRLDAAVKRYAMSGESFYGIDVSTALFDHFIGGYVLFACLFPGALRGPEGIETTLSVRQWAFFEDSVDIAHLLWSDLENLVGGLFGGSTEPVYHAGLRKNYRPSRNNEAVAELWDARELARRALRPVSDQKDPAYRRRSIGLRLLDAETTWDIDTVLRASVHQRLIWFAAQDVVFPIAQTEAGPDGDLLLVSPDEPDKPLVITDDHGVFATVVPETIGGVVALDLVSTFRRERQVGRCGHCEGWMLLSRAQVARAENGGTVYHADCRDAHRLAYFRQHAKDRYRARIHTATHIVSSVNGS